MCVRSVIAIFFHDCTDTMCVVSVSDGLHRVRSVTKVADN